jgi:thioredoxin-dependent peroxiredoxin
VRRLGRLRVKSYTIQKHKTAFMRGRAHDNRSLRKDDDERKAMATLREGDKAPDFELSTDGGGRFRLSKQRGKPVVVYFYPKDDTSGCTLEAIDFTRRKAEFDEMDTLVVGLSPDSPEDHDKFKEKHGLGVMLAADQDRKVAETYGSWVEKSMYGRKYMGVDRSTFLVDRNGVIARIWRNVKVKGHVDEVLEAARLVAGTSG